MTSIRFYLVAATLACITLINFLSVLHGYRASMLAAEQLFDQQLIEMTGMLASARHHKAGQTVSASGIPPFIAFQIWTNEQLITARSANAPASPISPFEAGYYDRNFGGYRWRIYSRHDPATQEWLFIAQRSDIRYDWAEKVILESVLPTVLVLPLLALMIWGIVSLGLKPLHGLARQLQHKQADDLTPVLMHTPPQELQPLLDSTNALLTRLQASFLREEHFSADAAHELRTPISVLKVHLYNLQAEWPDQADHLHPLQTSIDRMGYLVEQILALYRSTPDQATAHFEGIELFGLTRQIIAATYQQFDEKQQRIQLEGETAPLTGDRFALETLLQNLLGNACKYSPWGGDIKVTIRAADDEVQLQIEDSGPGIPVDKYPRVFERFYRLQGDQHNANTPGCGLGLAIVKHIVELHKASIELGSSRFNSGLRVRVRFPLTEHSP